MFSDSKLFRRFFAVVMLIIAVMFSAIYIYSVPLIQQQVYEIERNSSRLALNNVFQLANKMYANLEGYRRQALDAHKQRLKAVVTLTEAHVQQIYAEAEQGHISVEQARQRIFNSLRNFTYSDDGYIWLADHDSVLLSHPDPRYQEFDARTEQGSERTATIQRVINTAIRDGEGFYQYSWQRLHSETPIEKISYVKNFPRWGFVIGSGLYLDDIEAEVQQRKQAAIQEVRDALREIRIAKTGYVYIFDSEGHLLAHPNPTIDKTSALKLLNPITGQPIIKELVAIADTGQELQYKWDRPSDPGNYIYDKLSVVRSLDGFGWYICSSVYIDELRHSSTVLSQRILTIALISIMLAISLALFFIRRITAPIKQLARTAAQVRNGDLSASSGIVRDDELGALAETFDSMVLQLRNNFHTLDATVKCRTAELAQLEERQRLILDALPAQIAYLDDQLHYQFVNQGYADQFCKAKAEIIGQPIASVIGPEMMATIKQPIAQCLAGEEVRYEYPFERDGKTVITRRTLLPDRTITGEITGLLNLSLDITAEKEAERRLTEAQRMNATGQLAGGLAHDFNNLLSITLGNLLAASDHYAEDDNLHRYLKPAIRASRRGADITGRLLTFSRRQALSPRSVKPASLLQELIELLSSTFPADIELVCQPVPPTLMLVADPHLLENALINLALNARDAMPDGGAIVFHVAEHNIQHPEHYDEAVPPGRYIQIDITDSGCGFSADALQQAFEPFFTTRMSGGGSGLGLSMVYGFIKQSSGYIRIVSTPGQGATISLLLPAAEPPQPITQTHPQPVTESTDQDNRGKLILLVEDDTDVRTVVREQLVGLGFAVIEASDSDEAEQLIPVLDSLYGMVSDINMPGRLNGFGLADLLQQKMPTAHTLLISGYAWEQQTASGQQQRFHMLRKPFDQAALKTALGEACNR